MAALAHIAVAFAVKPMAKKINVILLIIMSIIFDLLYLLLSFLGIENANYGPWSHSLLMSFIWSIAIGLVLIVIVRDWRTGILVGCVMFSHWLIDFITNPTGAVLGGKPLPPNLPIAFGAFPKVGLGLYNHSLLVAQLFEYSTLIIGLFIYVVYKIKLKRMSKS